METLISLLPFALLFLLCPLMMLFMHGGGGHDHAGDASHAPHGASDREELARYVQAMKSER